MPADQTASRGPAGLRILHVASGFTPWLVNGLVLYVESLMRAQLAGGHEVHHFLPGRQYPLVRRPRMHRWSRDGVTMHELINSPVVVGRHRGTADPDGELHDADTETAFAGVIRAVAPALVHIHDLGGLPSSLVEIARAAGTPVLMTLHDYFPLCPVVKLYDVDCQVCLRRRPGEQCARCCANAPRDNGEDRERTFQWERLRLRHSVPGVDAALRHPVGAAVGTGLLKIAGRAFAGNSHPPPAVEAGATAAAPPQAYQRRRDVMVERLNECDLLIAYSRRAADVYAALGVAPERLRVVRLNPEHVEALRPKRDPRPGSPIRFGALNVTSRQKGAYVLATALLELERRGLAERFRVSLWGGGVNADIPAELRAHPSVTMRGDYDAGGLDSLLEEIDVGIVPSVWEEVLGFVGLEFLAKGIPVIGNAIGGIPEYTRDGVTGWLNRSSSAEELAGIMENIVRDPRQVAPLGASAVELRDELITPFAEHAREMDGIYRDLVGAARAGRGANPPALPSR